MSTPSQFLNTEIVVTIEPDFAYETTSLDGTPSFIGDPSFPVTEVSADGTTFTAVPPGTVGGDPFDAGGVTDGPYLDSSVDSDGSINIHVDNADPSFTTQQLINDINSNTSGTDLEQTLYYEVSNGSATVVDSADLTLNDITTTQYNGGTIAQDSAELLSGLSVSVAESTDTNGNLIPSNPTLTLDLQADASSSSAQGLLELTGGSGTISGSGTSELIITGTESQINADLACCSSKVPVAGTNDLFATIVEPGVQQNDEAYFGQITTACYLRGTRMLTPNGEVAIENLSIGDELLTASGARRPVRWLGFRRLNCAKHPHPDAVWPVLVRAGAFAEGSPRRDLWLSRGHSVFVDGALIQIENLINDATIVQVPRDEVEYWHVELDAHDIVMAEGLPAESYLDTGNRTAFVNGGSFLEAHPDFTPRHWRETCAPLVMDGPALRKAKATLLARAQQIGYQMTTDSDAHVLCEGRRIERTSLHDRRWAFVIPAGGSDLELRCRGFVPAHVDACSSDRRLLGLSVSRVQIDGVDLDLKNDGYFASGWHQFEAHSKAGAHRWSHERVPLPEGARLIVLDLVEPTRGWAPRTARAALTLCG